MTLRIPKHVANSQLGRIRDSSGYGSRDGRRGDFLRRSSSSYEGDRRVTRLLEITVLGWLYTTMDALRAAGMPAGHTA